MTETAITTNYSAPWVVSAYEDGWTCVRDSYGAIVCKLGLNIPSHAALIAAAPTLLAALEHAQWHLMGKARKDPVEQEIVFEITAAIAAAKET